MGSGSHSLDCQTPVLVFDHNQTKGNKVSKYLDLTIEGDLEPTYNKFQKVAMGITSAAIVGIVTGTIISLANANIF